MCGTSDLQIESNGHCFACLSLITPGSSSTNRKNNGTETGSLPHLSLYSLKRLSIYLKLDINEVLKENDMLSQNQSTTVKKSRLKVHLCKTCTKSVENFSKLYLELEKIQMEVMTSLCHIYETLNKSDTSEDGRKFVKVAEKLNQDDEWRHKLDVLKGLRKEIIKKCSRRITLLSPRVKVHKMGIKKIIQEKLKLKQTHSSQDIILPSSLPESLSDFVNEEGNIKVEQPSQDNILDDDDDDHDYFPDDDQQSDEEMTSSILSCEAENTKIEVKPDISANKPDTSSRRKPRRKNIGVKIKKAKRGKSKVAKKFTPKEKVSSPEKCQTVDANEKNDTMKMDIEEKPDGNQESKDQSTAARLSPSSSSIPEKIGTAQSIFNSKTGKRLCKACSKEFDSMGGFRKHYVRIHLIESSTFSICADTLNSRFHLKRHIRLQHPEQYFKCEYCPKYFFQAGELQEHTNLSCINKKLKDQETEVDKTAPDPQESESPPLPKQPPVLVVMEGDTEDVGGSNISMSSKNSNKYVTVSHQNVNLDPILPNVFPHL